jgi:flagellar biosynthetic protein FliO
LEDFISGIKLIGALIGVVLVIFLAYWGTTWFSKKYNSFSNGKYIKVLERSMLSQDKLLALAKVKDKVYLIAVTGQHIETIDTFGADEFPDMSESSTPMDFSSILKGKIISQIPFIKQKGDKEEDEKP